MRFVRFGDRGSERPGMVDADGVIRDLSDQIRALEDGALDPDVLSECARLDPATLPAVAGGNAPLQARRPDRQDRRLRPELSRTAPRSPASGSIRNRRSSSRRRRRPPGRTIRSNCRRWRTGSTGAWNSPWSSGAWRNMSASRMRCAASPASPSPTTSPSATSSCSAAASGRRASRTTPSPRSAPIW